MIGLSVLETALLLGVYVLLAGGYGLAYTLGRLWDNALWQLAARAVYGLHGLVALAIVAATPLGPGWKGLIVASSLAFLVIPPVAWRYLRRTHDAEVSA